MYMELMYNKIFIEEKERQNVDVQFRGSGVIVEKEKKKL